MTKRSTLGGATLLALALLFIGLTVIFNYALRGWRLDLTENRLYTIAPGTERILENIREPVNLYFFYSQEAAADVPALRTYGNRVREFLEELEARADGKLRLQIIDPQPFSEDEDRATEFGIQPMSMGAGSAPLYFGLAGTNSTDGRETIGFFDPAKEEFLEYDVVRLIHQLANPKKPVVGWLSSLPGLSNEPPPNYDPMRGAPPEPWMVFSHAQQLFDVRHLGSSVTSIDPEIDLLVIVHPKNLSPEAQFAIDQFALRGGRVALFVDPIAQSDPGSNADPASAMMGMTADKASDLRRLLDTWGIEFDPREVVADLERALVVSTQPGMPPTRHLGILGLDESNLNTDDVVTAGLANINVATAGHLRAKAGATIEFEPLLQSSAQAAPLPAERFQLLFDPGSLMDDFQPKGERYVLAARVSGKVKTAFPEGPPSGVGLPQGATVLKESAEPLNLVVFADTDMLTDFLWLRRQSFFGQRVAQAFAHNGDLVLNTFENLVGSSDLISVRGRSTFTRPFHRVEAIRRDAEARFRAKEQELEEELRATDAKLRELESQRGEDASLILTPAQQAEIERFQQERVRIRKELREVRLGMDQDIRRLGNALKFVNIIAVPGLFALAALLVAVWRRRRRAALVMLKKEAST